MSRDYQDDVCWERARLSEGQKSVRAAYSALSLRNDTYTQSRLSVTSSLLFIPRNCPLS